MVITPSCKHFWSMCECFLTRHCTPLTFVELHRASQPVSNDWCMSGRLKGYGLKQKWNPQCWTYKIHSKKKNLHLLSCSASNRIVFFAISKFAIPSPIIGPNYRLELCQMHFMRWGTGQTCKVKYKSECRFTFSPKYAKSLSYAIAAVLKSQYDITMYLNCVSY